MNKLKLVTIVGTRPEIIKLSSIIKLCDQYFNHILVHTGQNYDVNLKDIFFTEFDLRPPDKYLNIVGESLGDSLGNIISKSYNFLKDLNPDALLILGDTNSALSVISAKRLRIPIFHMEAGNRCFDENVPEEINRKIIDHISDLNMPYTEHARRNLLLEGLPIGRIFKTGSPMTEVIYKAKNDILKSNILDMFGLIEKQYAVLSIHREENVDNINIFSNIVNAINEIAETYKIRIIYSVHPRSRKVINDHNILFDKKIMLCSPFGFFDYNKLQINALCTLSDSGTLAEESSLLSFPAISIRTSTERPEVFDCGSLMLGGITTESILKSFQLIVNSFDQYTKIPEDYNDKNVSSKVVSLIQSFTPIIKSTRSK
jgi:UDP-N-acetyl-L-fucosamine synthase